MPDTSTGPLPLDVAILALAQMDGAPSSTASWLEAEATLIRNAASSLLRRESDASALLSQHSEQLVRGIELVPFLVQGGAFGPSWAAHPFASAAMHTPYKLREPDITRSLERLMSPSAGRRGVERAISFLRVLGDLAEANDMLHALEGARPIVRAEYAVRSKVGRRNGRPPITDEASGVYQRSAAVRRIDLLFEWPVDSQGSRAIVVVEAKLGASVGLDQLPPYRAEAKRLAKGGPITLVLLTARADKAERKYRSWSAVRWFALMRRWEHLLALAGDDDPEFARVRAHIWHFILSSGGIYS